MGNERPPSLRRSRVEIGVCPSCRSPRIGSRWRVRILLRWRCRDCRASFSTPEIASALRWDVADEHVRAGDIPRPRAAPRIAAGVTLLLVLCAGAWQTLGRPPTADPPPTSAAAISPLDRPTIPPAPTAVDPTRRHAYFKQHMLFLINGERKLASVGPLTMGDNIAAQLHAEAAHADCIASHWGTDGLKPYMRYTLAGGQQANFENISGLDYCRREGEGVAVLDLVAEAEDVMRRLMLSPIHRDNILYNSHRKVNIGLAFDRSNIRIVQHFEGDYIEYEQSPVIQDGDLIMSGSVKNGVAFVRRSDLSVQIFYDPPPRPLTAGQVSRTYCYDNGPRVAEARPPILSEELRKYLQPSDEFRGAYHPCPNPYDVPADAPAATSVDEAHEFWQTAKDANEDVENEIVVGKYVAASEWTLERHAFSVRVDISDILAEWGDGVYTIRLWGVNFDDFGNTPLSRYSIFHNVTPPDTYSVSE